MEALGPGGRRAACLVKPVFEPFVKAKGHYNREKLSCVEPKDVALVQQEMVTNETCLTATIVL